MMNCREYINLLTSDRLSQALTTRVEGALHRLICRNCRTFTRNDEKLRAVIHEHQTKMLDALKPPDN